MNDFYHFPQNKVLKFATHRLIDSVWVLLYLDISDTEIQIVYHGDLLSFGVVIEKHAPSFRLVEDDNRIVQSAQISDRVFTVINPEHVFGYRGIANALWLSLALKSAMAAYEEMRPC